jgi:uncharacterized membrane protein
LRLDLRIDSDLDVIDRLGPEHIIKVLLGSLRGAPIHTAVYTLIKIVHANVIGVLLEDFGGPPAYLQVYTSTEIETQYE